MNEYRHILVPVDDSGLSGTASLYYCAGRLEDDVLFEFEGELLTGRPVRPDGTGLNNGEHWVGPRPGIPYVLSAAGADICYETPATTSTAARSMKECGSPSRRWTICETRTATGAIGR